MKKGLTNYETNDILNGPQNVTFVLNLLNGPKSFKWFPLDLLTHHCPFISV